MTKTFDCVAMKHRAQEIIQKQLSSLTTEEKLRFWQKRGENLKRLIEQAKENNSQQKHIVIS